MTEYKCIVCKMPLLTTNDKWLLQDERIESEWIARCVHGNCVMCQVWLPLEALDEIERLQQRIAELQAVNEDQSLTISQNDYAYTIDREMMENRIAELENKLESTDPRAKVVGEYWVNRLREEEARSELHANLNRGVANALGLPFGENWSDLPEKVSKLKQRIAELEQERQWIPTSERLPKDDGYYYVAFLISGKKYVTDIYYFKSNSEYKWYRDNVHFDVATFFDTVAYWTVRPQPPKEEE